MRNLKKLLAVVVAVALVLTSMTAAFAAETSVNEASAKVMFDLKLFDGTATDGTFVPDLGAALTREQGAKLVVTMFGMKDKALAMSDADITKALSLFADAGKISTWAKPYVAYAVTNNVINGIPAKDGTTIFNAAGPLLGKQLANMILKQLGYTPNYEAAVTELSEADGSKVVDEYAEDELTRDNAVGYMYGSLTAQYADKSTTVIAKYIGTDAVLTKVATDAKLVEVEEVAPVTLAVDTVSSNNLREIFVKFNKEVNKDTITTANFTADSKVVAATLLDDKVTAKLTVADGTTQQTTIDLVIKNVKDADGKAVAETKKSVTLFDTAIPEATAYKFTGPQTIEVTMSEPVCPTHSSITAVVDNGIYGAGAAVKAGDEKTVVITLGTVIPEGEHKLVLKGAKDFADYKMLDKEFAISYAKDSSVSVITVAEAAEKSVTLKFSKPLKFTFDGSSTYAKDYFYHTYTSYKPSKVTSDGTNAIVSGTYYDKVVLDFSTTPLPSGNTKVVVIYKVGDKLVSDAYGISLPQDVILTTNISVDVTPPTITKVEAVAENKVEITFSEAVTGANDKANYTFKKSDGTAIDSNKVLSATYDTDKKKATVIFSENLAGGGYSVEVKNIKDNSVSVNAMVIVPQPFTVSDKTAISAISKIVKTSNNVLYVTFPEAMSTTGTNSVLNVANYMYNGNTVTDPTNAMQVTDAAITVFGTADKVKIEFPAGYNINNLYVRNVADAAGNVASAMFLSKSIDSDLSPQIYSVKSVALDKVEIVFDTELSSISADNISINGLTVAQVTPPTNKDGKATVTATLKDAGKFATTADKVLSLEIITGTSIEIKSITGKVMDNGVKPVTSISTDGIAPTVKEVYYVTGSGVIAVLFSEAMNGDTLAAYGSNGFKVGDKTVTGAAISTGSTTQQAIIILKGDFGSSIAAIDLDVSYTPGSITDKAGNPGNVLAAFTRTDALKAIEKLADLD